MDKEDIITSKKTLAILKKNGYKGKPSFEAAFKWLKKVHNVDISVNYSGGGLNGYSHYNNLIKNKWGELIGGGDTHYKSSCNQAIKYSFIKIRD